ncbi:MULTISPECIES: penicillin-binding transpeptidase domain-containing protein [Terrisporobacter]|uniref:Penicillin-binding transpeptidase domain-containing protein n=1 Tax=Terrisporobacter muris TaxID=2963284 RepID=A0A9X2M9I2_9FIRM|nr:MULTISPECIES: penicillin-binding transpeptidase domain-containing protein [Terrisporobacter]MCC3668239.1 penicillin-binding transpeptidase domain-containing protein [Terrisporobacter mayombei]MCR1822369.1 penicillin-binding transpeptidase domain-containing protein [Terrisporobacter muris]MDU6982870.1 penicillin-binding transpeptidase domain-containing protein [Terrisporobacter othiniensis]MDY3373394.1 penicillin-binding transpeptidase domain-containing protein [Terrisporobacter othiniensis]
MKKKIKKLSRLVIVSMMIISVFILSGCSDKNEMKNTVKNYTKLLNEKKYGELYEILTTDSKEYIKEEFGGKEGFVNKYSAIYSAMGVNNIKIDVGEIKDKSEIPITISMNTIGGKLKYEDAIIKLKKEDDKYKICWNESLILPDMVQGDKIRVKVSNGNRGEILDRDGNLLAYNGEVNYINIDPKLFKKEDISDLAKALDISEEYIEKKIENNINPDYAINIVKVSKYEEDKVQEALKIEGVMSQVGASRVYAKGEAFGSLLGYIGDITAEELEKNAGKGYTTSSQVGKNGLEQVYEDTLRATDGVHIYIERGGEDITLAKIKSSDGKDIKLAIDSDLQKSVYDQMDNEKGASIAMNSATGEVLAMVSSPSYDSNTMVTYKTKTIAKEWEENKNASFDNRANNLYSPGSTMKLITASIGMENKAIDPNEKMKIEGVNWQKSSSWGNYKVTRVKNVSSVNLYDAVVNSDNIYFADKAIKIGSENLIEGAKKFGLGADIKFEYPMSNSQISNSGAIDSEILLGDTGYGQGEVLTTPLQITMAYSALGNEGKIMTPRLVISENKEEKVYSEAIQKKYLKELQKDFAGVINDSNGSGYLCKIEGVNLAGKTGTAEIKSTKEDETGNENSWFVAVDMDNSKLAISMVMENMKDKSTSKYLVPKVKNIMKSYISEDK